LSTGNCLAASVCIGCQALQLYLIKFQINELLDNENKTLPACFIWMLKEASFTKATVDPDKKWTSLLLDAWAIALFN